MILDLRFIDDPDRGRVLQMLVVKRRERIVSQNNPHSENIVYKTLAVWTTVRYEKYDAFDGQEVEFIGAYEPKTNRRVGEIGGYTKPLG